MHATLEELAPELESKVNFGTLNIMDSMSVASDFGIMGTPTLIMFKDGNVAWQHVGALKKDKLKDKITAAL